jgi:hypothetical protein
MAITFPRSMPALTWSRVHLRCPRVQSVVRTYGRMTQVQEVADPLWLGDFTTGGLTPTQMQTLAAWLDSLRGGLKSFLASHPILKRPSQYYAALPATRADASPFDGTASLYALSAYAMTIQTLPAGLVLKEGDRVGLVQSGRYSMHRIIEDATASGLGEVSITVEPRVNLSLFTTAADVVLDEPKVEMILIPDSLPDLTVQLGRQSVSFSAIQKPY